MGKVEKQWDYRIYYQWQALERDSVLSVFSQDDFLRTTTMRAHLAVGIRQIEVLLPRRLGVRLDVEGNTSGIQVSDSDFRKVGNTYTSHKYADASQRLELTIATGLGGASIRYTD